MEYRYQDVFCEECCEKIKVGDEVIIDEGFLFCSESCAFRFNCSECTRGTVESIDCDGTVILENESEEE